ncbi:hypothetical protein CR513_00727, partial [Mucuna pruriens]
MHKETSVKHPQANGQAIAADNVILGELRQHLDRARGLWAEHLPSILRTCHCSPQSSIRETPYRLMYGTDVMILFEIAESSLRRNSFDPSKNSSSLRVDLDLVEEVREQTCYDKHISPRIAGWHDHLEDVELHPPQSPQKHYKGHPSREGTPLSNRTECREMLKCPSTYYHRTPLGPIRLSAKKHLSAQAHTITKHPSVWSD